ncbi:hypothetical protein MTO96_048421 [Rhipicephalus appendiculatus]
MKRLLRTTHRCFLRESDPEAGGAAPAPHATLLSFTQQWSSSRSLVHCLLLTVLVGTVATVLLVAFGMHAAREAMLAVAASQHNAHSYAPQTVCVTYRLCLWFRHAIVRMPLLNLMLPASRWFLGGDGILSAVASGISQGQCDRFARSPCS